MSRAPMRVAFFGSSLVSAYWNGAATYYRGIVQALHDRGHRVTFYEPDAYERQRHRDIADPDWARVVVYENSAAAARAAVADARGAWPLLPARRRRRAPTADLRCRGAAAARRRPARRT